MKIIVIVSAILAVFALALPVIFSLGGDSEAVITEPSATVSVTAGTPTPVPTSTPDPVSYTSIIDSEMSVNVLIGETVVTMSLYDYLVGVVSAEMPASFELEALKAQAVSARTCTLYKMIVSPSSSHPEADICDDITCCQAYSSLQALREKWGSDYETNINKIYAAVSATDGLILTYDNQPALAVFHSSSAGVTEDSGNIWQSSLPYLKSVSSPETAENVPDYVTTLAVSLDDFKETVLASYPSASFGSDVYQWITNIELTSSGRVATLNIGGVAVTGKALRQMFELRSTAVGIEVSDNAITFTITGYGHGVGMSQYGANVFSLEGYTYDEILALYYPGTVLTSTV